MGVRRRTRVLAWMVGVLLVLAVASVGAYRLGYLDDYLCADDRCTPQQTMPPEELALPDARAPGRVLELPVGPYAGTEEVRRATLPLLEDKSLGKHVGLAVTDLTHGTGVWTYRGGSYTPASILKLFTSLTAETVMDPQTRFATTTVRSGDQVVLVGGGDPYLTARRTPQNRGTFPRPATLSLLATRTADALKESGTRSITLGWDDSLFTGPAVNPRWPASYISSGVTTPVSALWVDQGVVGSTRSRTPARDAAQTFAGLLRKRGITVATNLPHVDGAAGNQVAEVRSATLAQIVQSVLETSDNEGAEVLLRHAAIAAGRPGSFLGGVRTVRETLTDLGVPWGDNTIHDGSGLSRADKVSLRSVVSVLQHGRSIVASLPVAGFNGSLADRFTSQASAPGLGMVRAKTGTLTGVHGLAGTTVDEDGTVLAFVVIADKVKVPQTLAARATLDDITAALTACSCGAGSFAAP